MKYILRIFGLVRKKDICKYLDDEIKSFEDARKNLTDVKDILYEYQYNTLSHWKECLMYVKLNMKYEL
jgi:hypothetical protein